MPRFRYKPVEGDGTVDRWSDDGDDEGLQAFDREVAPKQKTRRDLLEEWLWWICFKLQAVIWVGGAAYMLYYTNFFYVLWNCHGGLNMFLGVFSAVLMAANLFLLLYLSVISGLRGKSPEDMKEQLPYAVQTIVYLGVLFSLTFTAYVWPLWGLWVPVLEVLGLLGFINSAHFLPGGNIGAILSFTLLGLAVYSAKIVPHSGHLHHPEVCL